MNVSWSGGSEPDRKAVADLHDAYLEANAILDWNRLGQIWSGEPGATFFNMNGFTYQGRDHWVRLWKYYGQFLKAGRWEITDVRGEISGDLAVVWCHRKSRLVVDDRNDRASTTGLQNIDGKEFPSRSTMVFRREKEGWRVVHAHFSAGSSEPRPGGI